MYPCYCDVETATTSEVLAFQTDCDSLGMAYDLETWYITEEWAAKFKRHLALLLPIADSGNPLAQYHVAVIYMVGYCYSNQSDYIANYENDNIEATNWLIRAARQGIVVAVDNLLGMGIGPEVERLHQIYLQIDEEIRNGQSFQPGETWRRAYGAPVPEK